ncbi:NUDIX hydrolase [Croceitalea rosinachiae]|uniref:NUDIX hydrolase n=1 Tax=Croceitalea rosinachiae TaxID=3075596 RepID=A0ABU3AAA6_9FLAO|nr:NUDIX hydrolase [Croceitalea sp. F388]MDT0606840.1 NUDIX hydrolase [Croceitalea sp. F388]
MELENFLKYGENQFLPNLSIDLVIIGYQKDDLKCLLLKVGPKWVLPGGHIKIDESVDMAVSRVLQERTSLKKPHFKFLKVFGDKHRNFKEEFKVFFKEKGIPWQEGHWLTNRFVTLAYYSLVDIENTDPKPGDFDEAAEWFSFDELPDIGLDHESIIRTARHRLKEDIQREQLTYNLLSNEFTMPELHRLHETILKEKLDRSRFQKKMLGSGLFERLPKLNKSTPGSNPYQYRLVQKN